MSPSIREQSAKIRAASAERLSPDVVKVFDRSIDDRVNQGVPRNVIAVGDTIAPFVLGDATGNRVSLDQLVAKGPAVIVFYRGSWCPYCNMTLRTYERELVPELEKFASRLVAISPQSPDESPSTNSLADLDFTVLSDPGSRVADTVGIVFQQADQVLDAQRALGLDLAEVNAEGSTRLPMPTVLGVDRDHSVRFVDVQPDYTKRTEVAEILAALAAVGS